MNMRLEDEFGDILGKARRGQGHTVQQLESLSKISSVRILGFESYELKPERAEVDAVAGVLNLDATKLWRIASEVYLPKPSSWEAEPGASVAVIPVDVGGYQENCYVVSCPETRRAVVFDPGGSAGAIADCIFGNDLIVDAVAITHGHADHVSGVSELASRVAIHDFFIHGDDADSLACHTPNHLDDGDEFRIGTLAIGVLHTPGHTAGSVCYVIGRLCLVGDTLFAGSVGKAMQGPGSYLTLLRSVREKLLTLPSETALLPGHGPATTVEEELANNPFF